jgi:hypothetical protein
VNEVSIRTSGQPGSPAASGAAPSLRFRRITLDWGGAESHSGTGARDSGGERRDSPLASRPSPPAY